MVTRCQVKCCVAVLPLLLNAAVANCQDSLYYDPVQGLYHVEYHETGSSGSDTVVVGALFSGRAGAPHIAVSVSTDSVAGWYTYSYRLTNLEGGAPGELSPRGLIRLSVKTNSETADRAAPVPWRARHVAALGEYKWSNREPGNFGIEPDSSVGGFTFASVGLPSISMAFSSTERGLDLTYGEGPSSNMIVLVGSVRKLTYQDTLMTIGPRDPPSPFDLGDFIDTVATYPSRARALGWIDSAAVADQLQTSLDELSDDLAAGDSAHASGLIERTLAYVESQKDTTLSSEAYALFRYNLEYAQDYLLGAMRMMADD